MSRRNNRKGYRMLAYVLALVLLVTAVPVAVSHASDYIVPTTFVNKAADYKKQWDEQGNDGNTTLFIGDSFMSPQIWRNFYDTYQGKDVLRAGIESSAARDWMILADSFLAYTSPKNLVVNLGTNDITGTGTAGTDSQDAATVYSGLTTLFEKLHGLDSLKDTKIYYFGISERANTTWMPTVNEVNEYMQAWCAEDAQKDWITYVDTSAVTADDLYDGVHLKLEQYSKLVDALAATDIVIEDAKKNIDIYLIGGQSNAAGTSVFDEATLLETVENDSRYVEGFSHVLYAGVASTSNMNNARSFEVQPVKAGQGSQENMIGPELGMAASLSEYHNEETGTYAGIIKYAVGGTPLLNHLPEDDGTISKGKTWTPPSYEAELAADAVTTGTGVLYENFVAEVEKQLQAYKEAGFNPIIKGMYWMQGEADRRRESEYINAFECFVSDVRSDLTNVSGQDLAKMPIMVGEISRTFYGYGESTLRANEEFLAMQRMFPYMFDECYLIKNSVYDINDENGVLGSDNAHWNYSDCIEIGKLVGEQIKKLGMIETGDVNADTRVDKTDLSQLRYTYARNLGVTSQIITPDVYVSYDDGQVVNDGSAAIAVGTYTLDKTSESTAFVEATDVTYTASRNGDANGAIVTNHQAGPYTVVKDYNFGKDDFTVSTWFNVPAEATLSTAAGSYIIGNDEPNGTTGFSVTMKDGSLRFKVQELPSRTLRRIENTALGLTVNRDEWYNLVISRENNIVKVYFDGDLLFSECIPEGYDFGTRDLGVGAYVGYGTPYQSADMYFDDVQIYGSALSASEIKAIIGSDILIPERNDVNLDEALDVKDLVDLKIAIANFKGAEPVDVDAADVAVNFDGGTVKNSGTNSSMTAGAYVLGGYETVNVNGADKQIATKFDPTTDVAYTNGRDGAANGAIITNNKNGAYTVLDNLKLGTEDFAVSTWFKVPEGQTIGTGNGCYLLGTTKADDTTNGFRLTIRDNADLGVRFSFKAGANAHDLYTLENFDYGEWHHIAVSRIGKALFLYYDGELASIQIIDEEFDFGDAKIAFGAHVGETWSYSDINVMYDDVRLYEGRATVFDVRDICGIEYVPDDDTTDTTTAKVRVTFNGGTVENTGTDTNIEVGSYVMDATKNATAFNATDTVSYTTGRDGSENGAIITNHRTGPYAVVKDYNFGTDDFTISTWFNTEGASSIGTGSGFYLFGTNHPNTGNGFSVCIKKDSGQFQIRLRATTQASNTTTTFDIPDLVSGAWYNVTAVREGTTLNFYFDGSYVGTYNVYGFDFGTKDLAFGGYYGFSSEYASVNTYFDDIYVYGESLTEAQIQETIMGVEPAKVKVTFDNGTVENSGTDTTITAKAYLMNDATASATEFVETDTATFTTGKDGSENGAIITNHSSGPYTVIKNCNLGTGDFTISTWFNTESTDIIGTGAGGYLFGTTQPNDASGFSVVLKRKTKGTEDYQIRFRGAGLGAQFSGDDSAEGTLPAIKAGTWYNVTVVRVGTTLNIYFDGEMVLTCTVGTYDFGAKDLAFGAQFGLNYNNVNTYFDDIEIYGVGFSASQVQERYEMTKEDEIITPSPDDDATGDDIFDI